MGTENEKYIHLDVLNVELQAEEMTQLKLAQMIGISSGSLVAYLKQNYHEKGGSLDNINEKIATYLRRKEERGDNWLDRIVETRVMASVMRTIRLIHNMRKIGIVYGPAGIGKTTAAERYAEENHDTLTIVATPDAKSVRGVITLLYYALFHRVLKRSAMQGRLEIVDRLQGSDRLIIIDQAHKLGNDALNEITAIHDATKIAIILIGTELIFDRLRDPRAERILEELSSRIPIRREFSLEPDKEDLKAVCLAYDVTDQEIIKRMQAKGRNGGLRLICDQLKIARFIAMGQQMTMRDVLEAEKMSEQGIKGGDY